MFLTWYIKILSSQHIIKIKLLMVFYISFIPSLWNLFTAHFNLGVKFSWEIVQSVVRLHKIYTDNYQWSNIILQYEVY